MTFNHRGSKTVDITDSCTSATRDAFGRLRTSSVQTLFDSKSVIGAAVDALYWSDAQLSGAGTTATYNSLRSASTLAVSANTAGRRVRQSRVRMQYQSGKSQVFNASFVFGAAQSGITKRVGYFDDSDGLFFEQTGDGVAFVVRNSVSGSPVDVRVPQSAWNVCRFDGVVVNDFSRAVTLDWSKAQILAIDFEWLGTGVVRFGFVFDGATNYAHVANMANALTSVYMRTPNLPVRFEISNNGSGGAASMESICSTVGSEGGRQIYGIGRSINRGATGLATIATGAIYPLLGIRIGTGSAGAQVQPSGCTVFSDANAVYLWRLLLNPTFAGTALTWDAQTQSAVEAFTASTVASTVTGGVLLTSGYATTLGGNIEFSANTVRPDWFLGGTALGVPDSIVLAVENVTGSGTYYGTLDFHEAL